MPKMSNSKYLPPRLRKLFTPEELAVADTMNTALVAELGAIAQKFPAAFIGPAFASLVIATSATEAEARETIYRMANICDLAVEEIRRR